jgi:hypothetical protein
MPLVARPAVRWHKNALATPAAAALWGIEYARDRGVRGRYEAFVWNRRQRGAGRAGRMCEGELGARTTAVVSRSTSVFTR